MSIRTQKIDILHADRGGPDGLNGINGKQHSPRLQHPTDGIDINTPTAQKMTRCQRNESGPRCERLLYQL